MVANHVGRTIPYGGELRLEPRSAAFVTLKRICRRKAVRTIDQSMIIEEPSRLIHRVWALIAPKKAK